MQGWGLGFDFGNVCGGYVYRSHVGVVCREKS